MPSQSCELHFVLIPLMCPGHLVPLVDMGRLLAQHGVTVTIVTTPLNAVRFKSIIDRDIASGIQIRLLQLRFPCIEVGLPEGCENVDALPSRLLSKNFMDAVGMLQQPLEQFLKETQPNQAVLCLIDISPGHLMLLKSSKSQGLLLMGQAVCFTVICSHFIGISKILEKVSDDLESFVMPCLPDRIELTKAQLPTDFNPGSVVLKDKEEHMRVADMASYGLVVNILLKNWNQDTLKGKRRQDWCIGPVSLCSKGTLDMAQRGNKASLFHHHNSMHQLIQLISCRE